MLVTNVLSLNISDDLLVTLIFTKEKNTGARKIFFNLKNDVQQYWN